MVIHHTLINTREKVNMADKVMLVQLSEIVAKLAVQGILTGKTLPRTG